MTAPPAGFLAGAAAGGLKPSGALDVGLVVSERPAAAAGIFTHNRVRAAPVLLTRRRIAAGMARAIVANSGNANACTGAQGLADARAMGRLAGRAAGVPAREVLVASTGIIGRPLPMDALRAGIQEASRALDLDGLEGFARAIMTTDTVPKMAEAAAGPARVVGVAKGAGMIAPDMATLLVFLLTDAACEPGALRALLADAAGHFNRISIDGCESTNDMVIALAGGAAGGPAVDGPRAPGAAALAGALETVCASLARQVVDDGEGATKVVTIRVRGARTPREASRAARAVADSVLFRCALHAADPNWGRVVAALGASGIPLDPRRVEVWLGGEHLCAAGAPGPGDLGRAAAALRNREVETLIDLGRGGETSTLLTNDLSPEYIRFNAEYTT